MWVFYSREWSFVRGKYYYCKQIEELTASFFPFPERGQWIMHLILLSREVFEIAGCKLRPLFPLLLQCFLVKRNCLSCLLLLLLFLLPRFAELYYIPARIIIVCYYFCLRFRSFLPMFIIVAFGLFFECPGWFMYFLDSLRGFPVWCNLLLLIYIV